jgi:hypothetical protein
MYGLSVRMWEEDGEEEVSLVVGGLPSLGPLLARLLPWLGEAGALGPADRALLAGLVPPRLRSGPPPPPRPWTAARALRRTQEDLRRHRGEPVKEENAADQELNTIPMDLDDIARDFSDDDDEEEEEDGEIFGSDLKEEALRSGRKPRTEFECNVCCDLFPLLKELRGHQERDHAELYCAKCSTASPSLQHVSRRP